MTVETLFGETIERTFPLEDGGEVDVSCISGAIHVRGGSSGEVRLVVEFDEEGTLGVQHDGRRLVLRPASDDGSADASIELTVPRGTRVAAESVDADIDVMHTGGPARLHTVEGNITAAGLNGTTAPISIETTDGDIELIETPGPLKVSTSSGDVNLTRCSGELFATSGSGDITITEASGVLNAQAASGEIIVDRSNLRRFHINNINGEVRVETPLKPGEQYFARSINGEVHLITPAGSSFTAQMRTVNGDIRCDLAHEIINASKRNRQIRVGGGGATVMLETTNGDVHISRGSGTAVTMTEPHGNWADPVPQPPTDPGMVAWPEVGSDALPERNFVASIPAVPPIPPVPPVPPLPAGVVVPAPSVLPIPPDSPSAPTAGDAYDGAGDTVVRTDDPTIAILARLESGELSVDEAMERLEALR
jgi:hypothetical protein